MPGTSGEDLLRRYLQEVGVHPLLTAADEQRLGRAIAEGRAAAEELAGATEANRTRVRVLRAAVSAGEDAREQFIASAKD
jgi:hypothetical protein